MRHIIYIERKRQTKMMDCWYACIQMINSWHAHTKTKPTGEALQNHRKPGIVGAKLSFASGPGRQIMSENNLVDISYEINLDDFSTIVQAVETYGPLIVGGDFAMFGTQGHFVVLAGWDDANEHVYIADPAWGKGISWKPFSYLAKTWHVKNRKDIVGMCSVLARPAMENVQAA